MDFLTEAKGSSRKVGFGLVFFLAVSMISVKLLATPYELSYSGRLAESSGKPLAGPVNLRVTFFRSLSGNDQVAVAIPDFTNVALQDGIFQVTLALGAADFHTVFNGVNDTYIQVEDLSHSVTYPRQKFSAVPYALKVSVDGESITYNANGQLVLGNGANVLKLPATAGAANKVLKSDGAGALVWADDLSGGGAGSITATEVQDGTLTDADISNSAAIASSKISGLGGLATKNAIGSSDITDGEVTGADIANGTINDANISNTAAISHLKISGLGSAASKNVGTAAGDVASGNHTHTMSAITDAGALATKTSVGSAEIADGSVTGTDIANGTITDANVSATANISYLKINGLGSAASKNVGTTAGTVAAGDHGHIDATTSVSGFLSAADKTKLDGIASGAGVDTNVKTLCGDGEFLRGESATTCRTSAQIVSDGGGVTTADTGTVTSTMIANGTIADANVSGTAAIAGTKINPNFGAQNITTTGTISGNLSVGITSCPSGFTMVGTPGLRGTFCIDTNQRAASYFLAAKSTCHNLSLAEGKAYMCNHNEWYETCDKGLATGMTDNWEWVDMVYKFTTNPSAVVAGQSACSGLGYGDVINSTFGFRCCVR